VVYAYHQRRERYFDHQYRVTRDHVLPFVELSGPLPADARVLEIGCGEAGVLQAFLERGATAVGVDRSAPRLARGKELLAEHVQAGRLTLLHQDAQLLANQAAYQSHFDLIVLKDVIEHVDDRPGLFAVMRSLLRPDGRIFLAFPPWRMPFGGHQQICRSWILSRTPYFHLLPSSIYRSLLGLFREQPARIESLMDTKRTGLHSADFEGLVKDAGFQIESQRFYAINPMYGYRFRGVTAREQASWVSARSSLRDFVTTCAYYTVRPLLQVPVQGAALGALLAGLVGLGWATPAAAQEPVPAPAADPIPTEAAVAPTPPPPAPPPAPPPVARPSGLSSQAPATSGSSAVAKEGFQAVALPPADSKDSATFKLTTGGFLSTGNSRSLALTGVADYFLRRSASQFGAQLAVNYGQAAVGPSGDFEKTVQNYQARVRYDHFFSGSLAGFLSVSARKDEFQQLDLRLNIDPGLAYYFVDEKDQRLWAELGYDLQHDVRTQEIVDLTVGDPLVADVERSETRHNARVFAGYDNQVTAALKFNAGAEYLQDVTDTENARLNIDLGLTTQLNGSLSIASTLAIKYDNNPLPAVKSTDVVTALNLVYTLDQ
jgi:SAM-dependent methyltransferase/putative salt-induced outer membrane protein YdiY